MSFLPVALVLGLLVPLTYFPGRKVFSRLVRKKATTQLDNMLFPEGPRQKSEVLEICKELTGSRFSDEEILEYFRKMKGLQIVNINSQTNFWIKKYLFTPAPVKLNYFEQVKFYEAFLNFPVESEKEGKPFYRPEGSEVQTQKKEKATSNSNKMLQH
ncbi:MAG: hypothetical protein R6U46_02310 [Marinilabilia sp.]